MTVGKFYSSKNKVSDFVRSDYSLSDAPELVFITYGGLVKNVIEAEKIASINSNRGVGIILLEMLKPYDKIAQDILPYLSSANTVVFAEEGIRNGGAGMLLRDALERAGFDFGKCDYRISAIDDNFASPNEVCDLYDYLGLSPEKLANKILNGNNNEYKC